MEKQYQSDEIEIDLKELFFELLNEWKKILVATVLAGAIMFVVSAFILTPQYESTSALYLAKSGSISNLTDLQLGTNLAKDYMEVIDGRPILDEVIANLNLDMTDGELRQMLTFTNPANTRIIEITVTHPDAAVAKDIADEVADVAATYIKEKMSQEKPSVLQYGYVSENPVSPSVAKNSLIGALVGAILAVAVIIVTYVMNDTIMTPDDMERKIGIRVLASLPLDEEEDDGASSAKKGAAKKNEVRPVQNRAPQTKSGTGNGPKRPRPEGAAKSGAKPGPRPEVHKTEKGAHK